MQPKSTVTHPPRQAILEGGRQEPTSIPAPIPTPTPTPSPGVGYCATRMRPDESLDNKKFRRLNGSSDTTGGGGAVASSPKESTRVDVLSSSEVYARTHGPVERVAEPTPAPNPTEPTQGELSQTSPIGDTLLSSEYPSVDSPQLIQPAPRPIPVRDGLAVIHGYDVRVRVKDGQLELSDGIMDDRRASLLNRATSGLKRLVILGHTGMVSLEALKWLNSLGAAVSMIDADGQVILTTSPLGSDYPHLRRAQALGGLCTYPIGLDITRYLLSRKIEGQARVLDTMGIDSADVLDMGSRLEGSSSFEELRVLEANAAAAYWLAWSTQPINFPKKERVPEHWRSFGSRSSPIANGPRSAATPGNALLNYLYAILETETRIALLTVGLDPGIGFMHTDQPSRDGLALDVMEAVRPDVDAWLLGVLKTRTFSKREFFERHDGVVRITSTLTRELCSTAPIWRKVLAPVAEWVAGTLNSWYHSESETQHSTAVLSTKLSQSKRSAGRSAYRKGERREASPSASLPANCKGCGEPLASNNRLYCESCSPEAETLKVENFKSVGVKALASLRQDGNDPAHGGVAAAKRSATQSERAAARAAWEARHPGADGHEEFEKVVRPKLADVPLSRIVAVTGLSLRYASLIRSGTHTPHPMYFETLAKLALDQREGLVEA